MKQSIIIKVSLKEMHGKIDFFRLKFYFFQNKPPNNEICKKERFFDRNYRFFFILYFRSLLNLRKRKKDS